MPDYKLIIGNKNYSSWSLRAWLVMAEVGVPFEEVVIPLYEPESKPAILRYSASGKVPCLHHGEVIVWDSLAIAHYLDEQFPDVGLWPKDPVARGLARSIAAEMHSGFREIRQNLPMNIRASFPRRPNAPGVQAELDRLFHIWRDAKSRFGGDGPLLFGKFSIADAAYAPVVTRLVTYNVKVEPDIQAYMDAMLAHPTMAAWVKASATEPWTIPEWE